MPWSSRLIPPEEKAELLGRFGTYPESIREGCISVTAYYGLFLVLIPMMGGGLLGSILRVIGLPENPAFIVGLILATLASAVAFWRQRKTEAQAREDWHRRREAIEAI